MIWGLRAEFVEWSKRHFDFVLKLKRTRSGSAARSDLVFMPNLINDSRTGAAPRILVVDDEEDALDLIEFNLKQAGYHVIRAKDGVEAIERCKKSAPDLVILDLMLPEVDGLEVCRVLRRNDDTARIPIIMLTAKAAEMDRVIGLEVGADDYLTKPFSVRELSLRIRNLLRRRDGRNEEESAILSAGPVTVDIGRYLVTINGESVTLTATEFKLLTIMIRRRGRVQTRERLLQDVWDYDSGVDTRTVDTHVRRLRDKMKDAKSLIETVRGVGYRFKTED